jgi:hypothetical protein
MKRVDGVTNGADEIYMDGVWMVKRLEFWRRDETRMKVR